MSNQPPGSDPSARFLKVFLVPLGGKEGPNARALEAASLAVHRETGKSPHMETYLSSEGEHALLLAARPLTVGHLAWIRANEGSGTKAAYPPTDRDFAWVRPKRGSANEASFGWEFRVPVKLPRLRALNRSNASEEERRLGMLLSAAVPEEHLIVRICMSVSRDTASQTPFNTGVAYKDWLGVLGMLPTWPRYVAQVVEAVALHHADFEDAKRIWAFLEDDALPAG